MKALLKDHGGTNRAVSVQVEIEDDGRGIVVLADGYSCFGCRPGTAGPIFLEVYDGRLRLLVWDDINGEEASHVIDLERSREECRK